MSGTAGSVSTTMQFRQLDPEMPSHASSETVQVIMMEEKILNLTWILKKIPTQMKALA